MDTLMIVAIVVTSIAVVVQAGVLVAMYLMARRVTDNVNGLVNESHKLVAPLERITENLKSASDDFVIVGKDAKQEMQRIQFTVAEANEALRTEIAELRERVHETVDEVQEMVMEPVREWSALATGITTGVKTFFSRRKRTSCPIEEDLRQTPAA